MYRNDTRGTWALRSGSPTLIALMACALLAGCGNLTAGGLTGEATVTVSGDAPDAQGTAPQRAVGLYPTPPFPAQHDVPEGEVRADFFVDLVAANGDEVSMSEDQISIRVDVQGRQELDVAVQTVPAYSDAVHSDPDHLHGHPGRGRVRPDHQWRARCRRGRGRTRGRGPRSHPAVEPGHRRR